jgi:DNA polymerase sigma
VRSLPPLRPLLLAAKALLREAGLNEVFTGGLGSYTLALLVISHLQAEGVTNPADAAMLAADLSSPSHQAGVSQHLQQLSAAAAAAAAAAGTAAAGAGSSAAEQKQWDLGLLLHGFFLRFGVVFDFDAEAVSVNNGGVLTKPQQWVQEKR